MADKPSNLIYNVDEKPPLVTTLLLGLQHIFVMSSTLILPVVIVHEIGGTLEQVESVVSFSMIAAGLATILQAIKKGVVGSGYLCPHLCGPSYLSASMHAAWLGGLPLLFGMTTIAGVFEAFFSRFVRRLRVLFPTEVTGLVVLMVGIALIPLGTSKFLGIETEDAIIEITNPIIASITLLVMIGFNIWSKGKLRLYCVIFGMGIGYITSYFWGILTSKDIEFAWNSPLIALPNRAHFGWSFDPVLLIPFLVAALASSLKSVGDLITCQKISDENWKRPDMKSISGGLLADAGGSLFSGLMGGIGISTSSSNVGLSVATGATSRWIGFSAGILFMVLAFFPKLSAFIALMPTPVMGAILVFVTCFMVIAGMQIILSRMLDSRKIFVIGIALFFGLSVDILPELYANIHPWLRPLFSSSLTLSTVTAIILNPIFRIGITKHLTFDYRPGVDAIEQTVDIINKQGAAWGARKDIFKRTTLALSELFESLVSLELAKEKILTEINFNELGLDLDIRYSGDIMEFPTIRPSQSDLLKDEQFVSKLSGFLIRNYADDIKTEQKNDSCRIKLHFDH